MVDRNYALKILIDIISKNSDLEPKILPSLINEGSCLETDLGFDSIARMSILFELQEKFGDMHESEISHWKKISDIINSISRFDKTDYSIL